MNVPNDEEIDELLFRKPKSQWYSEYIRIFENLFENPKEQPVSRILRLMQVHPNIWFNPNTNQLLMIETRVVADEEAIIAYFRGLVVVFYESGVVEIVHGKVEVTEMPEISIHPPLGGAWERRYA